MNARLNKKFKVYFYFNLNLIMLTIIINNDLGHCQINDNYNTNILEEGNYDLLDVTDYHNMNLIVTTSKNIYTGIPPQIKTTTTANLINVTSIITVNSNFLLAACLQDSLLAKIRLNDGTSTSLLQYSDISITPSLTVPETTCSLSLIDTTVFIGYSIIKNYATEKKVQNIIIKIGINNKNSESVGPNLDQMVSIIYFQYPEETIKTNSHRQISCEPLKVSNNANNYRLVCLYEKTGYYQETFEYLVYAHSINQNFNGFEDKIDEFQTNYAYDESGFRIYKVNDTYARCLNRNFLTGIILKKNNNGINKITKVYESSNLYKFSADSNLFSYPNSLRFTAEKVNFMNKNDIYYFQINKETSSNYLMLYDYKESEITKILGYYNVNNDYIILV